MNDFNEKAAEGTLYVLLIHLPHTARITVGKLGGFVFPAGFYIYVGSAKRNLASRIARHRRKEKRLYWHIDYLLQHAEVREVAIYKEVTAREDIALCAILSPRAAPSEGAPRECKLGARGESSLAGTRLACGYALPMTGQRWRPGHGRQWPAPRYVLPAVPSRGGRGECVLAAAYAGLPGAKILVPGFGSQDCRCISHLIYFSGGALPSVEEAFLEPRDG